MYFIHVLLDITSSDRCFTSMKNFTTARERINILAFRNISSCEILFWVFHTPILINFISGIEIDSMTWKTSYHGWYDQSVQLRNWYGGSLAARACNEMLFYILLDTYEVLVSNTTKEILFFSNIDIVFCISLLFGALELYM